MRIERRIRITTDNGNVLIEFFEMKDRVWMSMYHMWIDSDVLMTVGVIALISAWVEHDDANFNHPGLMMSDV